jgi:hypothetical protein
VDDQANRRASTSHTGPIQPPSRYLATVHPLAASIDCRRSCPGPTRTSHAWPRPRHRVYRERHIRTAENSLLAEYSIRCGGYGWIAYHHVADTYVALFSHFIPCGVWEAIYILEGLLKNTSDLQPTTVHGDTQAQSTPVFGLAHLLGIKLMPRIRNWKDLTFFPSFQGRSLPAYRRAVHRFRRLGVDRDPLAGPAAGGAFSESWCRVVGAALEEAGHLQPTQSPLSGLR